MIKKSLLSLLFVIAFLVSFSVFVKKDISEKVPGFVPADEWFEKQRAYPFDEISEAERLKSIEYVKNNLSMNPNARFNSLVWQPSGPINIEGRITSVVIHPVDANTAYIGTANGGLWKTTDFCQSYTSIFDNQNTLSIGDVAFDPINPNVIYCGTGESNSLRSYYPGTGMYKSTDAGNSWSFNGLGNSFSIARIAVNPTNSQIVYAAALGSLRRKNDERGLYKTTDGGNTWDRVLYIADSVGIVDVVLDPSNPSRVFAASWERQRREDFIKYGGPKTALYLSTDAGVTWNIVSGGFPSGSTDLGRISIDISKSNPSIIYALTAYASGTSRGLYKSTNGGAAWAVVNSSVGASSNYAWFNRICKVDPVNPNNVYCGGLDMDRSTNGGTSFTWIGEDHVDQHAVAFAQSNPNYVIIGNDGGIEYSINGGSTWTDSKKLPITQFYAGEINTLNPNDILGGAQDNSTVRSVTGSLNNWTTIYGGDGFICKVDYQNAQRVYASSQTGGLVRSTNGGSSFQSGTSGLDVTYTNWMTPYVLDKNNPLTLYAGTYKVYRSTNGMQNWTAISPDLATRHVVNLGTITTLDVSKSNPSVIYAGTDDANVWVTLNGGGAWTKINTGLPNRWVTRLTIDPDTAAVCYITLSGYKLDSAGAHIYRTTNFGATWMSRSSNLPNAPINDVIIDPLDNNSLYVATDNGVFFTTNLGVNWYTLAEGLSPAMPCHDLTLHEATRKLIVWTHGKSSYSVILPNPPIPVELVSFTAAVGENSVDLKWTTASELNNNGFVIEKSKDGIDFYEIGFVKGKGTTTEKNDYLYRDRVEDGLIRYRIKQIDFDGKTNYSQVINIENVLLSSFELHQNYPNPFNPTTKIGYNLAADSHISLELYNSNGELIRVLEKSDRPKGSYEYQLNAGGLSSGVYFYKLNVKSNGGTYKFVKKLIMLK